MPEQLTDEQILDIQDDAPPSPETSEAITPTESSEQSTGEQYESTQERTATEPQEQVASKEDQEPATYEKYGTAEDFRELAEADRLIFSQNHADNVTWAEGFLKEHPDTFWRLWDIGTNLMQRHNPERWAQVQQAFIYSALQRDGFWDFLEEVSKTQPAARPLVSDLKQYFSSKTAPQVEQSVIAVEDKEFFDEELTKFFEGHIAKLLPKSLPTRERARLTNKAHDEIRAAINRDNAASPYVVTPQSLSDVGIRMARTGLKALSEIMRRLAPSRPRSMAQYRSEGKTLSDITREVLGELDEANPIGSDETRGMSDLEILSSNRAAKPTQKYWPGSELDRL